MVFRKSFSMFAVLALALGALPLAAQQKDPRPWESPAPWVTTPDGQKLPEGGAPRYVIPETPEQRLERIGTDEDPGINPDPQKVFRRFGADYSIHKFHRRWVKYTDRQGWVRPHPSANFTEEVYQENDAYVWVWVKANPPKLTAEERKELAESKKPRAADQEKLDTYRAYLKAIRSDFEPLDPPASSTVVRFEEASQGLPTGGSFRSSMAVADMNGDGFEDLVIPPQRGASTGTPYIYLGDGTGKWKLWKTQWPAKISYGSVVAGDFNKDKKMDLAFGIHLSGLSVMLGDGAGRFREVLRVRDFPTRRIVATDVDADGWTDVVALYEGPIVRDREMKGAGFTNLRAWMNRKKGESWEGQNLSAPKEGVSGDWLAVGDFNGDKRPDFVGSNLYFNSTHTHYLSDDSQKSGYKAIFDETGLIIPARSTYHAVAVGNFSSKKLDDSIISSTRSWPEKVNSEDFPAPPLLHVTNIERLSFEGGKTVRTPVMRWGSEKPVYGMAAGDVNGDGFDDVLFTREEPREAVLLLGDGKGGFTRASLEGLKLPTERNYDVRLADVNGDKRLDVVLMYETEGTTALARKTGSVRVFLNRGATK